MEQTQYQFASNGWHNVLRLNCETGEWWLDEKADSENAVTFREWHGHQAAYKLPNPVDVAALTSWLNEGDGAGLIAAIKAGYNSEWDGSNNVARYTETASDALDRLTDTFEGEDAAWAPGNCAHLDMAGLWEASEWFSEDPDGGVTADSTDADLDRITEESTPSEPWIRVDGIREYLEERRSILIEQREEADASV